MLKTVLTTAFIAVSIGLAMPGAALASPEDDFRDRCVNAGGTFTNGECKYPDGSTEYCTFGDDDWACYRDSPPKPTLIKNFGKLVNIPVKIVKTPIPPGPVETTVTIRKLKPAHSVKMTDSFAMTNKTVAPSARLKLSEKTTVLKFRKN